MNETEMTRPLSSENDDEEAATNPARQEQVLPAMRHRLSTRILSLSLSALAIGLVMIVGTLWLSWQLEGAGAAINDAGSLRMHATRLGLYVAAPEADGKVIDEEIAVIDRIMDDLQSGNPVRPLFLPTSFDVRQQMTRVQGLWQEQLKPMAGNGAQYLPLLPGFVSQTDHLVKLIETDNARKTALLRMSQGVLIVIACVGTLAMITLLYLWIIVPLQKLQQGLHRMAGRELDTRMQVEGFDEFGVLARGFNRMAGELQALYASLESRVEEKTAQLASQNRELTALYDMVAFFNQPSDIETMCRGFLQRVMQQFDAEGGSIRVIDPSGEKLHLLVSEGLSTDLQEHERCMKVDACFCGSAMQQGVVVIHDFSKVPVSAGQPRNCVRDGFAGVAVFRVVAQETVLGSFSLHFASEHRLQENEIHLLEALGQNLGVALENRRLGAQARQLAVSAERNLVAQGLHDSLAQGLNYLNLQVRMLDDAVKREALGEVQGIVPMLQTGVTESYQDVRELLVNFRSKLEAGELRKAVADTLLRFERQSGITVDLDMTEVDGAELPPEQQLQVLFILQEALSNIRKHAQAGKVAVRIANHRDFELCIDDDGRGFDVGGVDSRTDSPHVGLNIMRERAARLHAALTIDSRPGAGTRVSLILPHGARQAA